MTTQTLCCWTSLKPLDCDSWQEVEGSSQNTDLTSPLSDCWTDLVRDNISLTIRKVSLQSKV